MPNAPRRLTSKALLKAFNREGTDGVKSLMRGKPKSGPTLQRAIEELRQAGKDVTELETFYQDNYVVEEKEYVTSYDTALYGDKDEIAEEVEGYNSAKVYQAIRQFEVQPAMYKRNPGARGKGTNIFLKTDVLEAIEKHRQQKAAEYLAVKPDDMVTPADMLEMFPSEWGITNTSYCGSFVKFWGIEEQAKFRAPGAKGKGAALYLKRHIEGAIEIIAATRKIRKGVLSGDERFSGWSELLKMFDTDG